MYTVAKQNLGSPRRFTTWARLARAIRAAGAEEVTIERGVIYAVWPAGTEAYIVDREGNVDPQLAWDLEPNK